MVFKKVIIFILPIILLAKGVYEEPFGRDSYLVKKPIKEEKIKTSFLTKAVDKVIVFHQNVFLRHPLECFSLDLLRL